MADIKNLRGAKSKSPAFEIIDSTQPEEPDPSCQHKECRTCGETKELEEFSPHNFGKYGRRGTCKQCRNEKLRDRRAIARKVIDGEMPYMTSTIIEKIIERVSDKIASKILSDLDSD